MVYIIFVLEINPADHEKKPKPKKRSIIQEKT